MNLTINGRQVTVDDSFRNLPREEQDAAVEEIAASMPQPQGSGVAAGLQHGVGELLQGPAETAKQALGVGAGRGPADPAYVPANVTQGSWDPRKWDASQAPQAIAEQAPGLAVDAVAAKAGSKLPLPGRYGKLLGALLGAGLSGFARTGGDTVNERAANNGNAEPTAGDKAAGLGTAAATSALTAVIPMRLAPGLLKPSVGKVGAAGAADAAKRYATTTAAAPVVGAAGDVVTQAGTSAGTETGLSVDPGRARDAAVNAMLTAGAMGGPRLAGDAVRSGTLAKYGGDNLAATTRVATRLETASEKLGNSMSDEAAIKRVQRDLKNELGDAVKALPNKLSTDADNTIEALKTGARVKPDEIKALPSGPVANLAHDLFAADLMSRRGGHSERGWAGGASGKLDANLGYMLNPTRIVGGGIASLAGMHLLGLSNPVFAGSVAGGYGAARAIDSLTGMRSPAKTFVEHFADRSAQLRPTVAPQGPQAQQAPQAPWGPRPPPTTSVPPTGPQGNQQMPQGPWGARPQATTSVPPVAQPQQAQANPLAGINPLALSSLKQRFKENSGEVANAQKQDAADYKANVSQAFAINKTLDKNYSANRSQAESVNKWGNRDYKANQQHAESINRNRDGAEAEAAREQQSAAKAAEREAKSAAREQKREAAKAQTATERAQAKAERAKVVAEAAAAKAMQAQAKAEASAANDKVKAAAIQVKATRIKKSNGKVETEGGDATFMPKMDSDLYPLGITPEAYALAEADGYLGPNVPKARRDNYIAEAKATEYYRAQTISSLLEAFPEHAKALTGMHRQMQKAGGSAKKIERIRDHYASLLPPEVAKAVREAF